MTTERLQAFRAEITRRGLTGFIVPHADEYQNEYVPACAERLAWLTGFTGSAGTAVVLAGQAAIFVDGRYTLQVRSQVDVQAWTPRHLMEKPVLLW
ncbi:MAG: aminopeptidase P family protein, partial [Nitrospira sp. SB0666_bin_27]|nr:aminopeptidase P family protein [Nitrospira sp. SB0666_bin_27]